MTFLEIYFIYFYSSKTVQLIHKLNADILNQDLYLITNTEVDIEITPQSDDFMILQQATPTGGTEKFFKLEFLNISLQVKTVFIFI